MPEFLFGCYSWFLSLCSTSQFVNVLFLLILLNSFLWCFVAHWVSLKQLFWIILGENYISPFLWIQLIGIYCVLLEMSCFFIFHATSIFFFFWPHPQHVEVHGLRIETVPQLQQHQILNPLCHKGTSLMLLELFTAFFTCDETVTIFSLDCLALWKKYLHWPS